MDHWKKVRKHVATYGVALSALAGAEAAEGAVVSLTPNPGTLPYVGTGGATGGTLTLGVGSFSLYQANDVYGKSLYGTVGSITGIRTTSFGNTITTGMAFGTNIGISVSATGTRTYGFITSGNNVGWIRMNLGGKGGAVSYIAAAWQTTPGDPIPAGAIPEPGTAALFGLGLLALGAAGVRRMRREKKGA